METHGAPRPAARGSHPAAPPHLIKELLPQMAGGGHWRVTFTMTEMENQNPSGRNPPGQKKLGVHLSWEFLVQMRSLASIECD